VDDLTEAHARRALEQLRSLGWAVGPPMGRDEWRRAVRAQARRAQLRIRTGEACGGTDASDGQPRPWAATAEGYQAMRTRLRGLAPDSLGAIVVSADDGRRADRLRQHPNLSRQASGRPKM